MKIGVLTFHRAINIGGVLQSFALQYFLKENNLQSEIVDYRCPTIERQYYKRPFGWIMVKRFLSALLRNGVIRVNTSKFDQFRSDHLPISKTTYYPETISMANGEYTVFVTGSDQVWSWYCAGFDKTYFLDFVQKPNGKHSYAASFGGSQIPKEFISEYGKLLEDFDGITLREQSGAALVQSFTDQHASVVLDPTLLLNESDWRKELIEPVADRRPFVLIYMIAECKELLALAKRVGKAKNLDVIYISDRIYQPKGVTSERNVGPKEFLSLIDKASVVVTNSYHGICFSMVFKKDLYIGLLLRNTIVNARLLDVIKKYRLENRLLSSKNFSLNSAIDYTFIGAEIQKDKTKSVDWVQSLESP